MKYFFYAVLLLVNLSYISAEASPLNTESNLIDEGIDPTSMTPVIMDDIPLMRGLQKITDKNMFYITPPLGEGIKVVTVGIVDIDDVYNFYKRRLPAMGWTLAGSRDYIKGHLILHIDAHADGKCSTVTFSEDVTTP